METPPPTTPVSNYPRPGLDPDRGVLRDVAVSQKQVLMCVLGQFCIVILNVISGVAKIPALGIVDMFLALGLLVYMIIAISKLAKSLGESQVLYIICMFIPCVSLIMLLVLSQKATNMLQQAGIKVGLLGADPNSI